MTGDHTVMANYVTPPLAWKKLTGPWSSDCDTSFGAIAIHPAHPNVIYIGSSHPTNGCGLYKSTDAGKNWTAIDNGFDLVGVPPFQHYPAVSKIVIAPSDFHVLYIGTISDIGIGGFGRILRSNTGGRQWFDASGRITGIFFVHEINAPVLDLAVNPRNLDEVFVGLVKAGIFKTANGGKHWKQIRPGTLVDGATDYFYTVKIAPSKPSLIYGAGFTTYNTSIFPCVYSEGGGGDCIDFEGVLPFFPFQITGGGAASNSLNYPVTINGIDGPLITDLAIDPSNEKVLYASTIAYLAPSAIIPAPVPNFGVFKTEDGGLNWQAVNDSTDSNLSQFPIFRLLMDPSAAGTLYAVSGTSGIFKTTNGGQQWQKLTTTALPDGTFVGNIAIGAGNIYALTSNGVYVLSQ